MARYDPRDETQGTSFRSCQNCGKPGHEHEKERVSTEHGFGYRFYCPGTKPQGGDSDA